MCPLRFKKLKQSKTCRSEKMPCEEVPKYPQNLPKHYDSPTRGNKKHDCPTRGKTNKIPCHTGKCVALHLDDLCYIYVCGTWRITISSSCWFALYMELFWCRSPFFGALSSRVVFLSWIFQGSPNNGGHIPIQNWLLDRNSKELAIFPIANQGYL